MEDSHRFHGFPQIFVDLCGRMKVTQIWLSLRPPIFNSQMTQMQSSSYSKYLENHLPKTVMDDLSEAEDLFDHVIRKTEFGCRFKS